MKVERAMTTSEGELLSSFELGDCIRLVGAEGGCGEPFIGCVYIVAGVGCGDRSAVNLSDGCHREAGKFVLEPTAKVVIE